MQKTELNKQLPTLGQMDRFQEGHDMRQRFTPRKESGQCDVMGLHLAPKQPSPVEVNRDSDDLPQEICDLIDEQIPEKASLFASSKDASDNLFAPVNLRNDQVEDSFRKTGGFATKTGHFGPDNT